MLHRRMMHDPRFCTGVKDNCALCQRSACQFTNPTSETHLFRFIS